MEDSKENITGNFCVGELHYLPIEEPKSEPCDETVPNQIFGDVIHQSAGGTLLPNRNVSGITGENEASTSFSGQTSGELNTAGLDSLDFLPIKEEDEEAQDSAVPSGMPESSYVDNLRLYMSPQDREIDAPSNGVPVIDGQIISPPTKTRTKSIAITKKSPKSKVKTLAPATASCGPTKSSKSVSKKGNVLYKQYDGARDRVLLQKQEKSKSTNEKVNFMPCVVQLCEMTSCGVDCQCTVKARYPKKLKAVTLSMHRNLTSLSSARLQFPNLNRFFNGDRAQENQMVSTGSLSGNSSNFITGRIGAGKRQTKMSEKLKLFVEERQKHRLSQMKSKGKTDHFLCPICDHMFGYKHTLKQHMAGHRLGLDEKTAEVLRIQILSGETENELENIQDVQKDVPNEGQVTTLDVPSPEGKNEAEENSRSNTSRYEAIRTLLTNDTNMDPVSPGCNDRSEAHIRDSPESEKSLKVVLKVPQFKARSTEEWSKTPKSKKKLNFKKSDPKATDDRKEPEENMTHGEVIVAGSLGMAEVVSFESGKKVSEVTVNVQGMPDEENHVSILSRTNERTQTVSQSTANSSNLQEATNTSQDLENPSHIIVIAPINDFSPQVIPSDNIAESNEVPETDMCEATNEPASPSSSPESIPEKSKRRMKRKVMHDEDVKIETKKRKKIAKIKVTKDEKSSQEKHLQKEVRVINITPIKTRASKRKFSPKVSPEVSPDVSPENTKKSPEPRLKKKAKKLNEDLVRDSPLNLPEPEELSAQLLDTINKIAPPRLPSDSDSDATDAYGEDEDERDGESNNGDKTSLSSKRWKKKVRPARKSTGGTRWYSSMKTKQSQKLKEKSLNTVRTKQNLRRGNKDASLKAEEKEEKADKEIVKPVAKQNKQTASKHSRKEKKVSGKKGPGFRENDNPQSGSDDADSGVDFETDGSDPKQVITPVKPQRVNPNVKSLQLLSGELISIKELWTCVEDRLNKRTEKSAVHCPICDKPFTFPSALKRHITMHTSEKEFQCPHCPKAFSRKPHLTEHIRVHTGEKPFKCTHCPAAFAQHTNLIIHNRVHTGARPFKCPECDKRFRRQDAHTQHILTHHSNVKPYVCAECNAAFPCARYLKDHLRVHSKERPFKCDRCDSAFVCRKYLLLHVRALHLNERPFKCKECPAKFAQSGKLTEHMRVHTGERPYKCSTCGTSFSRSGHLRRHLLIHTGAKPYACKVCDAKFSQQDHLKRHITNIHKE